MEKLSPWQNKFTSLRGISEEQRWHYRSKLCLATAWQDGGWQWGMTVREELIAIPLCPVHSERAREAIQLFSQTLPPGPVFPMVFYVQSDAQVTLVLKTSLFPDLQWCDHDLRQDLAAIGIEGLWLHLNPATGRRIFAKRGWHHIWGSPRSTDSNGFLYGPSAFQQLIPALYRCALDQAEAFLAPSRNDSVVDLYCGIGASLNRWISRGARTIGVELGGEASECAQHNAPQASLLRGKCADRIPQLQKWLEEKRADHGLLYVNPPRTGIETEVLNWVVSDFRPERIAYLSCSAGTLRRDLAILDSAGYQVEQITPYDFFPQTYHVETLVLMRKRGSDA
jgi:tRNA/tmRNA/rRNA uracil-C5-methylase (TrmA/RlmC/RlmD family)